MSSLLCKGCGETMDTTGIPPFTLCECSDCGKELIIPFELEYLSLEQLLYKESALDIYSGFDKSSNSPVEIILLESDSDRIEKLRVIAEEEATVLATVKHPNICPVLNYEMLKGNFCVTSPLLDGFSFGDYNPQEQGLLDIKKLIDVFQAALLGLAVAHHKEIVHHNLCLKNIHIDLNGNVRVRNFYSSRFTYHHDNMINNEESVIKCDKSISPYFISPEKAESGIEDKRGDIFSFGVVMYYMFTGQYPFSGTSELETVYSRVMRRGKKADELYSSKNRNNNNHDSIAYVPPKPPISLRETIPESISKIIMRMLAYLPVRRPTFSEVLSEINLFKANEEKKISVISAQKSMVETKTRAIPKMTSLAGKPKMQQKKKRKWTF
jgi:serine/threonine protein kinase